ncbi:MAG: hypothetical protein IKP47_10320 [Ruminococcus sp.]|nr:hypothetical protein [Ruminococcus sp.]
MSVGLSASDGYILGTIPTVSSWNCSVTPIVKPIEPIAGRYSCSYTFTCRAPITNIDLDVATPLPLHDAEEPFVMTNGAAVERYEWVNQSGSNVARFFVNNTYTLKTYITAEEGYDFGSTVTATVNGKTAKITKAAGSTSATEYIVEYTFDKLIQYKVKFDPGKGTGTMSDVTVNKGFAYTVPECGFKAPAGHYFSKWTDGTNYYAPGDPVTVTSDITLTPVWICRVSGVNVVLTEPKSGEAINETMTSVTDGIDVARGTQSSTRNLGRWYHGDTVMSAGEKFVGGETYTAMFRLKSLTGYEFTETPDVYANGKKATFLSASGVYRTYTVSYTLPLETKYVSQVNVTLTEPKKGETINETMISSTEGIVVNRAKTDTTYNLGRWYHNNTVMKAGDKFLAGETYTAQFRLVPSTGYGLANNLKVYANGKQATLNTGALLANTYAVSFTLPEEQPETYDLCVGDVQVTDLNADDILGNGAAYYDPETNTLELIATVGGRVNYAVNNSISGLTILVNEDISLYGAKAAIRCAADTVITGPGKLTLKTGSNSSILLSSKDLLIEDANICTDTKYFVCGVKGIERLTVKNSTVDANCSVAAIDNIAELTLKDCSFLIPAGGIFKLGTVYKSDGSTVAARVKIVPGDNIRKGDINSDGHVDVTDLTILARSLAKWTGYAAQVNEANADVDGDGEVTVTDYSILARALARWPGYAEEHNIVLG